MERVKALAQHAHDLRNLAVTFRSPRLRQQLMQIAEKCDEAATDIAKELARKDSEETTRRR